MYPTQEEVSEHPQHLAQLGRDIDDLKWARARMKEIENLPKGKLRDSIMARLNSIVNGDESKDTLRHKLLKSMVKPVNRIQQSIRNGVIKLTSSKHTSQEVELAFEYLKEIDKIELTPAMFKLDLNS